MATNTTAADYAHEKQEVQYVEHVHDSPTDSSHDLQKERTLEGIDMSNSHAVKGDDSDGKVEWNLRSAFAAVFLAALYTGASRLHEPFVYNIDPEQAHKSFSTLPEARSDSLKKIWDSLVALHGFRPPTSSPSLRHALMLVIFRIFLASATLHSSDLFASVLDVSLSPLDTVLVSSSSVWLCLVSVLQSENSLDWLGRS